MNEEMTEEQAEATMKAASSLITHLEGIYRNDYFEMLSVLSVAFASLGLSIFGPEKFKLVLDKMKERVVELDTEMTQPEPDTKTRQKKTLKSIKDVVITKKSKRRI